MVPSSAPRESRGVPTLKDILRWGAAPSSLNTAASLLSRANKPWVSWGGQIPAISWLFTFWFFFVILFFFFSFLYLFASMKAGGPWEIPYNLQIKIFKTEQNWNEQFYRNDLKWQWSANSNHQRSVCEEKLNRKDWVIWQFKHKSKREIISIFKHGESSCLGKRKK